MPKYKIISIPLLLSPYNFDGKSGVTVKKICVCSLADGGSTKRLEVFKVSGISPDRIPKINTVVTLASFDQFGRVTGFYTCLINILFCGFLLP